MARGWRVSAAGRPGRGGALPGGGGGPRVVPHPRHAAVLPETNSNSRGGGGPAGRPPALLRPSRTGGRCWAGCPEETGPYRCEGAGRCLREGAPPGWLSRAPGQLSIRPSSARLAAGSQVLRARSQAGSREVALSGAVRLDGLFRTAYIECRLLEVLNALAKIQR